MTITYETAIRDFKFWSYAEDRAAKLEEADWDVIEPILEEAYPEGIEGGRLNDIFWFDFDTIAQWLGYKDEEDFDRQRTPDYIDDDELASHIYDWWKAYVDQVRSADGEDDLVFICEEVFGEDMDDVVEEWPADFSNSSAYRCLTEKYDEDELMDYLFEDDRGSELLERFPTKEGFRDEIMAKNDAK